MEKKQLVLCDRSNNPINKDGVVWVFENENAIPEKFRGQTMKRVIVRENEWEQYYNTHDINEIIETRPIVAKQIIIIKQKKKNQTTMENQNQSNEKRNNQSGEKTYYFTFFGHLDGIRIHASAGKKGLENDWVYKFENQGFRVNIVRGKRPAIELLAIMQNNPETSEGKTEYEKLKKKAKKLYYAWLGALTSELLSAIDDKQVFENTLSKVAETIVKKKVEKMWLTPFAMFSENTNVLFGTPNFIAERLEKLIESGNEGEQPDKK